MPRKAAQTAMDPADQELGAMTRVTVADYYSNCHEKLLMSGTKEIDFS